MEINGSTVNNDPNTYKATYEFGDAVAIAYVIDNDDLKIIIEDLNFRAIMTLDLEQKYPVIRALENLSKEIEECLRERG